MTLDITNRFISVYGYIEKHEGFGPCFFAISIWPRRNREYGLARDWGDGEVYYLYRQYLDGTGTKYWTLPFQKKHK